MRITPPGGPTDISSTQNSFGDEFDPSSFLAHFSIDINKITDSYNQLISTINQGGSEDSIKSAYNQLMSLIQNIPYGQGDPMLDGDLRELEEYMPVPDYLSGDLNDLHSISEDKIDFSDKSSLLFILSGFRDNLLDFNAGVKNLVNSVDESPINTPLNKSSVDQDFQNYENLLQNYIDGKVSPEDMSKFQISLSIAYATIQSDMTTLNMSLNSAQSAALNGAPFGCSDVLRLSNNFCIALSSSNPPSLNAASNLMTYILALQHQVDSLNF